MTGTIFDTTTFHENKGSKNFKYTIFDTATKHANQHINVSISLGLVVNNQEVEWGAERGHPKIFNLLICYNTAVFVYQY